jgi:hypothetical protein
VQPLVVAPMVCCNIALTLVETLKGIYVGIVCMYVCMCEYIYLNTQRNSVEESPRQSMRPQATSV